MPEILSIIIAYLLGSIPTAYIAGRLTRGVDIRRIGGGNMGALNTAREIGRIAGLIVLLIDVAKGAAAVLISGALGIDLIWVFLSGFAAVVGHCWPVFLRFKGGKGAAATIGVFFALAPSAFAVSLPFLLGTIFLTSNVTLGMAISMVFYPLFLWVFDYPYSFIIYAVLMTLFLAARYTPTALRGLRKAGNIKDFIIEKNYKPWQSRRDPPRK